MKLKKPELIKGYGYCQCGCGMKTRISTKTSTIHNQIKGTPLRFINGHNRTNWNGGIRMMGGYRYIYNPGHPNSQKGGYIAEHKLIVEKILNKILPNHVVIHHVNEKRNDNSNCNFVVCENNAYHRILHRRKKALEDCGNANFRKCIGCGKYDDPLNMKKHSINSFIHKKCASIKMKQYHSKHKIKGYKINETIFYCNFNKCKLTINSCLKRQELAPLKFKAKMYNVDLSCCLNCNQGIKLKTRIGK